MSLSLQSLPADKPEDIYAALNKDGAVVVDQFFDAATIDAIAAGINAALGGVDWCNTADEGYGAEFFGHTTKRLHGVLQYSPAIEACMMNPLTLATAERWLGFPPHFSTREVMAIGPGEIQQDIHTDAGSWRHAHLSGEILFSMTIAITDFTAATGATMVAPGSHLWPANREHTAKDFIPAEMKSGSALFYAGNLRHSGGANTTQSTRVGLYLGYIPFWLQPLENPVVTHPVGFLDSVAEETQTFMSYHAQGFNALLGR